MKTRFQRKRKASERLLNGASKLQERNDTCSTVPATKKQKNTNEIKTSKIVSVGFHSGSLRHF